MKNYCSYLKQINLVAPYAVAKVCEGKAPYINRNEWRSVSRSDNLCSLYRPDARYRTVLGDACHGKSLQTSLTRQRYLL
jgi:hypothetical protein